MRRKGRSGTPWERACRIPSFPGKSRAPTALMRSFSVLAFVLLTAIAVRAQSPYESSADFAKYAMKLREQALLKVEPQVFVPTTSKASMTRFPWKTNIVTTVFWIGEAAGGNNPVPNVKSSWDANWTSNYGGVGNPGGRSRGKYAPGSLVPRPKPIYFGLLSIPLIPRPHQAL